MSNIRLRRIQSGTIGTAKVQAATISWQGKIYNSAYTVTPTQQTQVLPTDDRILHSDLTIEPIPTSYGNVEWDGSKLIIS